MPLIENAINEIMPFAAEGLEAAGDLLTLEAYKAHTMRLRGHMAGLALRGLQNRANRQSAHMAAGLAQFIANRYAPGVVDDGDLDKVEEGLRFVIQAMIDAGAIDISGLVSKSEMPGYGTFTTHDVITTSGPWIAPVTGWYRITIIGAGGGGGKGGAMGNTTNGSGGKQGGSSSFDDIVADGGSGGGGGGSNGGAGNAYSGGGGGSGGYGTIKTAYRKFEAGTSYAVVIGGGGAGATSTSTPYAGNGEGPQGGQGAYPWQGGQGAAGGQNGINASYGAVSGHGGNGLSNGAGYGGGGGGGGGSDFNYPQDLGAGGYGLDGAQNGTQPTSTTNGGNGGNGGSGAVIIEYQGAI